MRLLCLLLLAVTLQQPARAADYAVLDGQAWIDKASKPPRPRLVDIGVPRAAAGLNLFQLNSFRPGGEDVVAKYQTPDGEVFATLYLYRPTFPDARLAATATGEVLKMRFGKEMKRLPDAILPAGGVPGVAYRTMVDDATFEMSANVSLGLKASFAAFLQAGDWLVKLRVSGPEGRKDEVDAAGRGILDALVFGKAAQPRAAPAYRLTECPDETYAAGATRLPGGPDAMAAALVGTATLGNPAAAVASPSADLCVMRRDASSRALVLVLRPAAGAATPAFMLLGDAGNLVQVVAESGARPIVISHGVGGATLYGPFDRPPSADQLIAMKDGDTAWSGTPIGTVAYDRKGPKLTLDPAAMGLPAR
ncbi:hypothetical protein [Sphingomonas profundi]|uniref:hypothetical protein n=1 Tax=Alterirhizorhabdus profundi TaxID=2681549 RepID=UPI0012E8F288|nr:hypothetical protein [Sphingomonas profundi]